MSFDHGATKEGEKQYRRWKKMLAEKNRRQWLRHQLHIAARRNRGGSGEVVTGFRSRAEMSVQFYLPFFIQAFFRSFVEPQAIFCREESPAA